MKVMKSERWIYAVNIIKATEQNTPAKAKKKSKRKLANNDTKHVARNVA